LPPSFSSLFPSVRLFAIHPLRLRPCGSRPPSSPSSESHRRGFLPFRVSSHRASFVRRIRPVGQAANRPGR
uniref:Uncharacterized protein n=1 Tax=Cucumis melo TaxID=3656 RepID=A0A9I9E2W0_CUCME